MSHLFCPPMCIVSLSGNRGVLMPGDADAR